MPRRTLYWLLQMVGWGILVIFNVPFMLMSGKPFTFSNSATTMLLCAACGLLLSEWWHGYLKRNRYPDLPRWGT